MFKRTVSMALEKETKGAIQYKEVAPTDGGSLDIADALMGTLYVRKTALGTTVYPRIIKVTVEF